MNQALKWIAFGVFITTVLPVMAQDEAAQATPENIPFNTPLATYGDIKIGLGEFFYFQDRMLKQIDDYQGDERKEMINQALKTLIFEQSIYNSAIEQGYGSTPEYLSRTEDMKNGYLAAFFAYHQFTRVYQEDEEELRQMYEDEKEQQFQPAKFTFRHIFLRTVDMPDEEKQKANERAQAAIDLIKSGSNFEEAAQLYSDSERKGAVVGPFNKRSYNEERAINPVLEEELLKLKPGEISGIVETKYGYEILQLESYSDDMYRPFEQLKLTLSNRRKAEVREEWKRGLVEEHWDAAVSQFEPGVIFNENAKMDDLVAVVYNDHINLARYQQLVTQKLRRNENESDEDYNRRLVDQLKYDVIFNYIAAKLAWDMNYTDIPRYRLLTKAKEYQTVFSVWWNKMLNTYMEENPVTEEEKKSYYEQNKQYFLGSSLSKVKEMTFKIPEHNEEVMYEKFKAEETTKNKAVEAIKRLNAGEDFAVVAKEMSESNTAADGGDLGEIDFQTEKLPKMVSREAMKLAAGDFTKEPVKEGNEFFVLLCYEKPDRSELSYNDPQSQERLNRAIPNMKSNDYYQTMMNNIVKVDEIEILYPDVYSINPKTIEQTGLFLPGMDAEEKSLKDQDSSTEEAAEN